MPLRPDIFRGALELIIALGFFFIQASGASITIVANPGPFKMIEEASIAEKQVNWQDANLVDDDACTECYAAVELSHFLARACGLNAADVTLCGDPTTPVQGDIVFLIGNPRSLMRAEEFDASPHRLQKTAPSESFKIKNYTRGTQQICLIEGADRTGTLYGAYEYLEQVGYHFFGLGEKGTVAPAGPVSLPSGLDIYQKPAYITRGFWAWEDRGNEEFHQWMARNKLNYWTAAQSNPEYCKKLGMLLAIGGHQPTKRFLDPEMEYPYNHPLWDGDNQKPSDPYSPPPANEYKGDQNGDGKLAVFEAHPEWYGLRQGQRQREMDLDFGKCNFCTSNRDAVQFLADHFVEDLIHGEWKQADIINFWMLDGAPWCECESCKAQGSLTDRLMAVIDQVQKNMKKAQAEGRLTRKVLLHTCAYHETIQPPEKPLSADFDYDAIAVTLYPIARTYAHPLGDPASTLINQPIADSFNGWLKSSPYKGAVCVGEYYNVSSIKSLPAVYSRIMSIDIPWYYRMGARHFQYMHTPTRLWGVWTLNQWLMAKLLWNTDENPNALLDEYFSKYYPGSSDAARAFYNELELATSNIKPLLHYVELYNPQKMGYSLKGQLNSQAKDLFPYPMLKYDAVSSDPENGLSLTAMLAHMQSAREWLDRAIWGCSDKIELSRLLEDERRFAYGEKTWQLYNHLARCLTFCQRGEDDLGRMEYQKARSVAHELEQITNLVQVASSHASARDGLEASQLSSILAFLEKKYSGN